MSPGNIPLIELASICKKLMARSSEEKRPLLARYFVFQVHDIAAGATRMKKRCVSSSQPDLL